MLYHTPVYKYYSYSYLEMPHSYVQMPHSYIRIMLHLYIRVTYFHRHVAFLQRLVTIFKVMSHSKM